MRVGDTVRRPAGGSSEFVSRLLLHLEHTGFAGAPRFMGYDEQGRETLSFIDGEVPSDCRSLVWRDDQIRAAMRLLRSFHDHTAGSALAGSEEVVCHNDFGPWNLVWREGMPAAIIDFDNAAPGCRMDDLAYAARKHLNLGLLSLPIAEQARRVAVLARAYGIEPDATLVAGVRAAQARMRALIESSPSGARRDDAFVLISGEQEWLDAHGDALVG